MMLADKWMDVTEMECAWRRRDAGYDGLFYFGVKTTGIFCRPSCPSTPNRENIEFFPTIAAAAGAGYRPCKRCRPELCSGAAPDWAEALMREVRENSGKIPGASELRKRNLTPERVRRWFKAQYGMSFAAWARGVRLCGAFAAIRKGRGIDDAVFESGYESHSGFREAFQRAFQTTPGQAQTGSCIVVSFIPTPLGPMVAGATAENLVLLEFADQRGFQRSLQFLAARLKASVLPGENTITARLALELENYFSGELRAFSVPHRMFGTPFQERVWNAVREISYGASASYAEIAKRIGTPGAVRAVGRANGENRLYLLVPCHRVISADGQLSGYGGGVWRKRLLLELEQKPGSGGKAAAA
jgi:AraC family transcriptional regulator of adaptative response/methylated-DNA-[protein]-cysteine methyltransferase